MVLVNIAKQLIGMAFICFITTSLCKAKPPFTTPMDAPLSMRHTTSIDLTNAADKASEQKGNGFFPTSYLRTPTIAIIGAGLSGLTMGHRLKQKGYNVQIYEARSRVGGRVHTVYVKNRKGTYSIAELGGHNITDGGQARYLLQLAKELGLEIEDDRRCLSRGFYTQGKMYSLEDLLKEYDCSSAKLKDTLQKFSSSTHSIADVLDYLFVEHPLLKRNFYYFMSAYEGLLPQDLALVHNSDTLEGFLQHGAIAAPQEVTGAGKLPPTKVGGL